MQQLWPVNERPQVMFNVSARHGHANMMRFLLDKHPQEQLSPSTIWLAAQEDHLEVLLLLLGCGQSDMPSELPADVSGRCLVALAKAGYRMDPWDKHRMSDLLSPWATLVGLVQWATRLGSDLQPGDLASAADQSSCDMLAPQGGNMLLILLARLPTDIAANIISQAVPTPAIADPSGSPCLVGLERLA